MNGSAIFQVMKVSAVVVGRRGKRGLDDLLALLRDEAGDPGLPGDRLLMARIEALKVMGDDVEIAIFPLDDAGDDDERLVADERALRFVEIAIDDDIGESEFIFY